MALKKITSINKIPQSLCRNLKFFFTDIDDTLTKDGMLPSSSFSSLWDLYEAGIKIIPVTGRPAGWCDHIARMWPIQAVIGENGSFYFSYNKNKNQMIRRFLVAKEDRKGNLNKLSIIKKQVLKQVKGSGIAADQDFRISDLAIDYCEDVERLNKDQVKKICEIAEKHKARYKVSSIHVNCWYGDYDKLKCLNICLNDLTNKDLKQWQDQIIYIGDSPNDEPMFKSIKNTIAVSNIKYFLSDLKYLPKYITHDDSARGFIEAVSIILRKRKEQ